jgi:hypothetical protein
MGQSFTKQDLQMNSELRLFAASILFPFRNMSVVKKVTMEEENVDNCKHDMRGNICKE